MGDTIALAIYLLMLQFSWKQPIVVTWIYQSRSPASNVETYRKHHLQKWNNNIPWIRQPCSPGCLSIENTFVFKTQHNILVEIYLKYTIPYVCISEHPSRVLAIGPRDARFRVIPPPFWLRKRKWLNQIRIHTRTSRHNKEYPVWPQRCSKVYNFTK